jgi:Asp-tRNA(Asn)/Glu-tRNA(Gln) amidotransferase A subunit family amidase
VLDASVTELKRLLNEGKVTSEDLVIIFHERCRTRGLELELVADFNFDDALKAAKSADQLRASTADKSKLPPLHGIPISIKDNLEQKGLDSTCGFANLCFNPRPDDGQLLRTIRESGAIPFVRSNIPQGLLTIESINNVWG